MDSISNTAPTFNVQQEHRMDEKERNENIVFYSSIAAGILAGYVVYNHPEATLKFIAGFGVVGVAAATLNVGLSCINVIKNCLS